MVLGIEQQHTLSQKGETTKYYVVPDERTITI